VELGFQIHLISGGILRGVFIDALFPSACRRKQLNWRDKGSLFTNAGPGRATAMFMLPVTVTRQPIDLDYVSGGNSSEKAAHRGPA